MYTSKRGKQKKRRKTQKQHCFMDEALLLNYPFPNKIFNYPKYVKGVSKNSNAFERVIYKGGATNFELGFATWYNYIVGLKDSIAEQIVETYKNTLPIPVIGEIVQILTGYLSIVSIPIMWLVGLIGNALTSLVSTVKTNWHYVLIILTSLDLIEWAGSLVDITGNPIFGPAHAITSVLNSTIFNFGAIVNFIWTIILTLWTIVTNWIPSNLLIVIMSNSLFSYSIVIFLFITIFIWITENLNPSYNNKMIEAKKEIDNIYDQLEKLEKNESNISPIELNKKKKKLEDELDNAKEIYKNAKKEYQEDLQKKSPNDYNEYMINELEEKITKAQKKVEDAKYELQTIVKTKNKKDIEKAETIVSKTNKKLKKATEKYQAYKASFVPPPRIRKSPTNNPEGAWWTNVFTTADAAKDIREDKISWDSELGGPRHGGNRNTRKDKQKEVDLESVVHRLLSKKSLANFKNRSTEELEEIRKKNPFPFEIALALGFMKKTDDGYELVEKRIQKIKEPVIKSMSFLNHRCKGCKPKSHRTTQKGGLLDAPLEDNEINSLKEALTGIKMIHTASLYAVTREAVETDEKNKMTGGDSSSSSYNEPFINISQTMNNLKSTDINWLKEKFPDDFKIAQKLGIVSNGEISHSAKEIINDTVEMSKSMIKKKIPKASEKVLFPRQ